MSTTSPAIKIISVSPTDFYLKVNSPFFPHAEIFADPCRGVERSEPTDRLNKTTHFTQLTSLGIAAPVCDFVRASLEQ